MWLPSSASKKKTKIDDDDVVVIGARFRRYITALPYLFSAFVVLDLMSLVLLGGHMHSARIVVIRTDAPKLTASYSPSNTVVRSWTNTLMTDHDEGAFRTWYSYPSRLERARVLILTPMKDSARHLSLYFALLDRITYPKELISLGILEGDSSDGTYEQVRDRFEAMASDGRYRRLTLVKKNFKNGNRALVGEQRHGFDVQGRRRSIQAKCRNHLQSIALQDEDVVLWLDSDLRQYQADIIQTMMAANKPIVSADCILSNGQCYDRNNWRETPASLIVKQRLARDELMFEGYPDLMLTHRESLCDIVDGIDEKGLVEIHGVGGTALMLHADLVREGLVFPTFPFNHAVETEGIAQVAIAMGVKVHGMTNMKVFHETE